ncbi:DUF4190 domain-containing protein [Mesobacillus harenae]|uniref:DUF4190 domain-containing protein n=1 Tax=Mesobacillus harenae TaxID=2213203 RepID=UPI0015810F2B|nr:DUF4190 domain-containing protein [Mesobacillus harenae]
MAEKVPTNSKAVISLTLGILSIFLPLIGLLLAVIGIVVSYIAMKEIKKSNEDGRGFAIAGLTCSIVGVVIQLFFVLIAVLSFFVVPFSSSF